MFLGFLSSVVVGILIFKRRDFMDRHFSCVSRAGSGPDKFWDDFPQYKFLFDHRDRSFWAVFPDTYRYLWVGLITGGALGILAKVNQLTGGDSSRLLYLCAVTLTALAMLFRKKKMYGYWRRYAINALLVAVGLFSGIFLGGIAVWVAIIALVLIIIAIPAGRSSSGGSSSFDSSSAKERKTCTGCSHYDYSAQRCTLYNTYSHPSGGC